MALDRIPNQADFAAGAVVNRGSSEVIRQRLYDWQLYPTAGVGQLSFFSLPQGQGVSTALGAVVGSAKTKWDTNMVAANTLPSGLAFVVETIEVVFFPGRSNAANTYLPAQMSQFAAVAAAALLLQLDDVTTFYNSGLLEFNILAKNYLTETVQAFPPKTHLVNRTGVATNSATTAEAAGVVGYLEGRPYIMDPIVTLQPAVNFSVNLVYPGVVATPSGFNGRVGVILDGYLQRAGQ
jgi:hypothetical protein